MWQLDFRLNPRIVCNTPNRSRQEDFAFILYRIQSHKIGDYPFFSELRSTNNDYSNKADYHCICRFRDLSIACICECVNAGRCSQGRVYAMDIIKGVIDKVASGKLAVTAAAGAAAATGAVWDHLAGGCCGRGVYHWSGGGGCI